MKCLQNLTGEVRRVTEYEAKNLVASGGWQYVSKSTWKRYVRPDLTAAKAKASELAKAMPLRRV